MVSTATFTYPVLSPSLIVPLILSMARHLRVPQHHIRRALQNAPQLHPFILSNVNVRPARCGKGIAVPPQLQPSHHPQRPHCKECPTQLSNGGQDSRHGQFLYHGCPTWPASQDHDKGCAGYNSVYAPRGFRSPSQVWANAGPCSPLATSPSSQQSRSSQVTCFLALTQTQQLVDSLLEMKWRGGAGTWRHCGGSLMAPMSWSS